MQLEAQPWILDLLGFLAHFHHHRLELRPLQAHYQQVRPCFFDFSTCQIELGSSSSLYKQKIVLDVTRHSNADSTEQALLDV